MVIEFTPAAAAYIQNCIGRQPGAIGLRVGIVKSGCSGLAYQFDYVHEPVPDAWHGTLAGIAVWIRNSELYALKGLQLDYIKQGLNQVLTPYNPNAQNMCGCGESFNVIPEAGGSVSPT